VILGSIDIDLDGHKGTATRHKCISCHIRYFFWYGRIYFSRDGKVFGYKKARTIEREIVIFS